MALIKRDRIDYTQRLFHTYLLNRKIKPSGFLGEGVTVLTTDERLSQSLMALEFSSRHGTYPVNQFPFQLASDTQLDEAVKHLVVISDPSEISGLTDRETGGEETLIFAHTDEDFQHLKDVVSYYIAEHISKYNIDLSASRKHEKSLVIKASVNNKKVELCRDGVYVSGQDFCLARDGLAEELEAARAKENVVEEKK